MNELLRASGITKSFRSGNAELVVLRGLDLTVMPGEMVAIVGPSGAGKSTLLHLLAALDSPTSGSIYFDSQLLSSRRRAELANFRNREIGFVWQLHHLLADFTATENVMMPLMVRGESMSGAAEAAQRWLGEVGLADRADHLAGELSGGEQQRVALARALVGEPKLLLADEPTGDLDEENAEAVFRLIQQLHRAHRLTSILATHNLSMARRCDRVLRLHHGKLEPMDAGPDYVGAGSEP